jgi:hypothetical protein
MANKETIEATEEKELENVEPVATEIKGVEEEENEDSLVLKFKKPYKFEGTIYNEIDLAGLEDLSGADMIAVNNKLSRKGRMPVLQEMGLEYAQEISAVATGLPVELFQGLSVKDSAKLKNIVTNFIYGEE